MIENDGDEVRAIGFIAMHAAHLEARIDDLLWYLDPIVAYTESERRWPVSSKIDAAKKRLNKLGVNAFSELKNDLKTCKDRFEWRNEILHSQLFSPDYKERNLVSRRPGVEPRSVTVDELYELANDLNDLDSIIYRPQIFEIPREVEKYIEDNKEVFHKTQIKDGHVKWPFLYTFDNSKVNCPRCLELIANGE